MKFNCIYPILFDELNLLLRFGYISIDNNLCVSVDGNEESKLVEVFEIITPYYDESQYLLLEFEAQENQENNRNIINIEDILKIYPLSRLAHETIKQLNLDARLVFQQPVYENLLFRIEALNKKKSFPIALKALRKCLGLPDYNINDIDETFLENIFKGIDFRRKGIRANLFKNENYWSYLIAYDSYNLNFPKSTLGYFYDAGEMFSYSKGQETFIGSKYFKFLENIRNESPAIKFNDIILLHENSEEIEVYKSQTIFYDKIGYIISPMFLMFKDDLRNCTDISKSKLFNSKHIKDAFGDSFDIVLVLLAAFFGYDKFSDAFYDKGICNIFKKQVINDKLEPVVKISPAKISPVPSKKKIKSKTQDIPSTSDVENSDVNSEFAKNMNVSVIEPVLSVSDKLVEIENYILDNIRGSKSKNVTKTTILNSVKKSFSHILTEKEIESLTKISQISIKGVLKFEAKSNNTII